MKKFIIFWLGLFLSNSFSFSIASLSKMSGEVFLDHRTWSKRKEIIKQQLKENKLPADIFKGQTIIGLDFSNMELNGKDLTNCKFFKVNLEGADLTNTTLHNTHFDRCNLVGAIFRYSLNNLEKVFKINSNDDYELVKQYSDLMNEKERNEKAGLKEEAANLEKQAQCLNHLFEALRLNLSWKKLKNFNLIDINIQHANLYDAQLEGTRISKGFTVPAYNQPENLFDDFKKAVHKNTSEKQDYLKLINMGFNIFSCVSNEHLKEVDLTGLNLTAYKLNHQELQGINLEEVNFTEADLSGANLTNANLISTTDLFPNPNLSVF